VKASAAYGGGENISIFFFFFSLANGIFLGRAKAAEGAERRYGGISMAAGENLAAYNGSYISIAWRRLSALWRQRSQ